MQSPRAKGLAQKAAMAAPPAQTATAQVGGYRSWVREYSGLAPGHQAKLYKVLSLPAGEGSGQAKPGKLPYPSARPVLL